jgi:hypothetical protein
MERDGNNVTMYEKWWFTTRNFWNQYGSCKGLSGIERERMQTLEGNDKLFLLFLLVLVFLLCLSVVDVLFHHALLLALLKNFSAPVHRRLAAIWTVDVTLTKY